LHNNKELGVVLTPPKTAEYIISRLGPIGKNDKILDPCVGPGIFVKELLNIGIKNAQCNIYSENKEIARKMAESLFEFAAEKGIDAEIIAAWNYVQTMAAGDRFELVWSTDDTNCFLAGFPASAPVPAIPSIILTATQIR